MSEPAAEPAGVLLVDKPQGITSHDVVDRVRRHYFHRRRHYRQRALLDRCAAVAASVSRVWA